MWLFILCLLSFAVATASIYALYTGALCTKCKECGLECTKYRFDQGEYMNKGFLRKVPKDSVGEGRIQLSEPAFYAKYMKGDGWGTPEIGTGRMAGTITEICPTGNYFGVLNDDFLCYKQLPKNVYATCD